MEKEKCSSGGCPCHKMAMGFFVVLFGLTFLLREMGVLSMHTANMIWPVLVMLGGVGKLLKGKCMCCSKEKSEGEATSCCK